MEHKLAYTEAKALCCGAKIDDPLSQILMILTKYVFDVCVWLTEHSITVGSVTLRFYCTDLCQSYTF